MLNYISPVLEELWGIKASTTPWREGKNQDKNFRVLRPVYFITEITDATQITLYSKQGMTIISILLMKMIVIKESFSRRPVYCRNNTSSTLTLLCLLVILGNSLYKRSMSFAKSWIALTPHWIGSLNIRSGVASESILVLARPSLTSSLYRLKVSKSWRWMPQTRPAIMAPYLSRFLKTALTNSYRPFPTWLIFRSVAVTFRTFGKKV